MLSPRHSAQLGLSAASITLVASITILIVGSSDPSKAPANVLSDSPTSHVTPLADGQLVSMQSAPDQHLTMGK